MPRRLCNRVPKFPKQRAVRACASTSRRPHPHPSRSQRINANAQRERERERNERRERTRLQNRARIPYETQTQKRNANWPHQSEQTMPWMPPMAQQRVVSQITVRHVAHRCASNAEQCTIRNTRLPSLPSAAYRLVAVPLLEGDARFSPILPDNPVFALHLTRDATSG